jgi:hypothetical protein
MTAHLNERAKTSVPGPALDYLAQILALSRHMRHKAPVESYFAGIEAEEKALAGLNLWLARGRPDAALLQRVLDELNRHADETPPPLDCLKTECYRSAGVLANPSLWTFSAGPTGALGKIPERPLAGVIALSLTMPWESERKARLWQLVWAGSFRAVATPHWQLPPPAAESLAAKETTLRIMRGWLPARDGPDASVPDARLARWLDESWLSDERLFCPVARLRAAATRAQWRVAAARQAVALGLYQIQEGKAAGKLHDLAPKYFPSGPPVDPYSGQPFGYRASAGEHVDFAGDVQPGQAVIWSTGPDRIDHGGQKHGGRLADDDAEWSNGGFDLVTLVPHWP